jgi:hypothetical protein
MLQEQKERFIQIIKNIGTAQGLPSGVSIEALAHGVASIENVTLPATLIVPANIKYGRIAGDRFTVDCQWNIYLYIRQHGEGNQAQAEVEPLVLLDIFASEFLTRPQLQFSDNGLTGIVNNAEFDNPQNLARPITYPPNDSRGAKYWGAVFTLSITQHQTHILNESGALT